MKVITILKKLSESAEFELLHTKPFVNKYNKKHSVDQYRKTWETLKPLESYVESGSDVNNYEGLRQAKPSHRPKFHDHRSLVNSTPSSEGAGEGWVRIQRTDVIRTRLISILMGAKMQRLEVVRGHSEFLSHFSIPQANPTQPVIDYRSMNCK